MIYSKTLDSSDMLQSDGIGNNFLLIGISYRTAPVDIREHFSFTADRIPGLLDEISEIEGVSECVAVSTCNRTEIYMLTDKPHTEVERNVGRYICDVSGKDDDFLDHFYTYRGREVVEQLFQVTSGLDSMIIGETQILGQVKSSFALACDNGKTGPVFNRLFHLAFQVRKQIRNETSIGKGVVSVSSAAVLLAKDVFGCLKRKKVLLVGTGKIGTLCAKQLIDSGVSELYIANRTYEHAAELAEELSGAVIPFEDMHNMFNKVDIIITSVTSSAQIVTKKIMNKYRNPKTGAPVTLIDMGVPRNIDPGVTELENIHLFNIDDLENVTLKNRDKRKNEAVKAKAIIVRKAEEFYSWLKEREIVPAINKLRKKCEHIRVEELKKINHTVTEETFNTIDLVTRRIVRKILHNPTITVRSSESDEDRRRLIETINELFINEPVGS
ncbi:glutamyl-tRNA reductase [Candidatus Latescibacterota bacterium]